METVRYTTSHTLTNYLPIPRGLLGQELPAMALLIYALLLDRCTLSRKNSYCDTEGWIYVVYPILELCGALGISTTTAKNNLAILERQGLIRRVRHKRREANRCYLLVPSDSLTDTGRDSFIVSEGQKFHHRRAQKLAPSYLNKQPEISNSYRSGEGSL